MNAAVQADVPTLREELDRKVFETLDWIIGGLQNGKLTKDQASFGLDTLHKATCGLVDDEFIEIMTAADELVKGAKSVVKMHFHAPAGDEIQTFVWTPGTERVTVCKRVCGMPVSGSVKDFDSQKAAAEFMGRLSGGMEKKGWIEL